MFYGVLKGENKKPSNSKDLKRITVANLVTIFNPELIILGGRIVQSRARVYRRRQSSQIKDERGPATNRCLCLGFGNALFDRKMEFVNYTRISARSGFIIKVLETNHLDKKYIKINFIKKKEFLDCERILI